MAHPSQEEEIRENFAKMNCEVEEMQWKQNGKDRWMCLANFESIDRSLLAMGLLQDLALSSGKKMRLSFTRSKLEKVRK